MEVTEMIEIYDSIMRGLQEAAEDAAGKRNLPRRSVTVVPVKDYSAEEVKEIRKSTGMTQKLFAEYMGVSDKTVEAWEAGTNRPSGPSSRMLSLMEENSSFVEEYPFVKIEA
jgi:putative transcriptional regulator